MISSKRRAERQELYQTKRWKECRAYMFQKYPLCVNCLKEGRITPTQCIHHIKSPFARNISPEEKERRAYTESNLMALCNECHIKEHHKFDKKPVLTKEDKLKKYS